ncbi:hypothetical protein ACIBQX_11685 [Nonomuraea sp. NPDC049714]|uniref:hypothetical protein n=1 Tax=Nonomuraea sp. NPDC049714 TaxID=3364357 RepID=UPI00378B9EE5
MADLIRNVFAGIGALVVAAFCWCAAAWAWSLRQDRRKRVAVPPPDDPAWDRLWAALLADDDIHDVFPEEEGRD